MILTLKALLKHLVNTELRQMAWKRMILTLEAMILEDRFETMRRMTRKRSILTLKALLKHLVNKELGQIM
jgi:hypothetical protein